VKIRTIRSSIDQNTALKTVCRQVHEIVDEGVGGKSFSFRYTVISAYDYVSCTSMVWNNGRLEWSPVTNFNGEHTPPNLSNRDAPPTDMDFNEDLQALRRLTHQICGIEL
jgi:N-acetyl-anhydromuramyl-L-alanine amidase AmpD